MEQQPKKKEQTKISLKDYLNQKAQETKKKKKSKLPMPIVIFLATPFLIVFCFGLFFVPYLIYQIATGKSAAEKSQSQITTKADYNKNK